MSDLPKPPSKFRWAMPLALLVLACSLPWMAAWVFYLNPDLLPEKRTNFGNLIQPPHPLRNIHLRTLTGKDIPIEAVHGKWNLLWLTSFPCGEECDSYLHRMHNIRLALREDSVRFQYFAVPLTVSSADVLTKKKTEFADAILVAGSENDLRDLATRFTAAAGLSTSQPDGFYLVDPLGNLMMRYDADADPRGILRDLQRLLKYSLVGR
jgi:cytochrome oxidase Cu insertion factor (SCO1/SenC/PrrC family)